MGKSKSWKKAVKTKPLWANWLFDFKDLGQVGGGKEKSKRGHRERKNKESWWRSTWGERYQRKRKDLMGKWGEKKKNRSP